MLDLPAGLTAASVPPVPAPDPLAKFFWEATAEGRLDILRCDSCGHYIHYPRPICDRCLGQSSTPASVSGRGTLYSYTEVVQAFHPYFVDKLPYLLAVVELEEEAGLKVTTNLVGAQDVPVRCGMAVEATFEEVAPGFVLPLFRPATRNSNGTQDGGQ